tara:strand:+ start:161 stop:307 length:147 start_codon:yes stop_codon:yes gene_type:complete
MKGVLEPSFQLNGDLTVTLQGDVEVDKTNLLITHEGCQPLVVILHIET